MMAVDARLDTYGLQDALKKMQKLDPAMRRTLLKDTKEAAKPLVDAINGRVPSSPPLRGMAHNGRTGWSGVKKVQISLNTRKPRKGSVTDGAEQIAVVRVVTKGAPVAITDMAGKAGGTKSRREPKYQRPNFASALDRIGSPSRFMWKDVESMAADAERALKPIIDQFMRDAEKAFK
jgi:hypothetical protein